MRRLYGQCTVDFDGYMKVALPKTTNTKDDLPKFLLYKSNLKEFLSSSMIKTQLISMLNRQLLEDHQAVVKCASVADTR